MFHEPLLAYYMCYLILSPHKSCLRGFLVLQKEQNFEQCYHLKVEEKKGTSEVTEKYEENQESYSAQIKEKEFQITVKDHNQLIKQKN